MKKCPYCAEEIQDAAIKCKHCMEFLDGSAHPRPSTDSALKWYYRKTFIIIAILSVGPFALPLIWFRPQTSIAWKIGLTVATSVFTVVSLVLILILSKSIMESFRNLQALYS